MRTETPHPDDRLTRLTESLLRQRSDITDVYVNHRRGRRRGTEHRWLEFLGGPHYFDDDCIYDPVDDATAKWLLESLVARSPEIGWSVGQELSSSWPSEATSPTTR